MEAGIAQAAIGDPRLPLLVQLPGIGLLAAATLLAAIGEIGRFEDARHLVGYAGFGTRVHDSGKTHASGRITKAGRKDLRWAMVEAARHARLVNPHWKEVYRRLEPRLGRNKAIVALAQQMLVAVWHILTKRQPDRFADWPKVATNFMSMAYNDFGEAEHIPGGRTAPQFTRWCLDTLGVGEKLQRVKFSGKTYILPKSTLPGAAPEAEPIGRGRQQNSRQAKHERVAQAEHKRAQLAAKQAEAEARMGRPRKTRSDKGVKRGPHKKK